MRVYTFGNGTAEGSADLIDVLGGKGAGLAGMSRLGVSVPPGFTLPTDACRAFYEGGETLPEGVWEAVERGLAFVEEARGRRLGDPARPLLVSVRSGAAVSMPGMMDTILNVGLTPEAVEGLAAETGDRRFALDSHRRFLEMFAEVALGVDAMVLQEVREAVREAAGLGDAHRLPDAVLAGLPDAYRAALWRHGEVEVPVDPRAQVEAALVGVFRSWNTRRAARFRRQNGIPDDLGTAVTVQAMVFGNLGAGSATGVAFTRDPNSGERRLFGEYLPEAQGEDVVSGAYTPYPLSRADARPGAPTLEDDDPTAYTELGRIADLLERSLGDVQDLEFTIERGTVWMLQTRAAKRSARAEVRTAVEMSDEGVIDRDAALLRVDPERLTRLIHPSVDLHARPRVLARGLPASPGAVSGIAVFDPEEAVRRSAAGERVILVRVETSAEDMEGIRAAVGVLTSRGGMTSHAALVARGLGRCCVTGCADIVVNERRGQMTLRKGSGVLETGTWLTLDGGTGEVMLGEVATSPADPPAAFATLMGWADARRHIEVRANADNAAEAGRALELGADGIGLCRTEHMFLDYDRVSLVREMVFADSMATRRAVVERILPLQRNDFGALLEVAQGKVLAVRLLDLPLHDVMPSQREELSDLAAQLSMPVDVLVNRARVMRATNPVMGHRGCRLGLTFPEVYEIQVRALFEAALDVGGEHRIEVVVPLVTCAEEMHRLRRRITHMAARVSQERGAGPVPFTVGTMIESPRACLVADRIAEAADFFLFGANDLTSATFCIHRDDAGRYLPFYLENEVLAYDPFVRLDREGVGQLVRTAIDRGRGARPGLTCGLSGAQTADPDTIAFCHEVGLDYVSCAAHRVPIARLAAAQAAVRGEGSST